MDTNVTSSYLLDKTKRWTDDLPSCKHADIGHSINCIYGEDDVCQQGHNYENRSLHFECNESTSMYAIFDGHGGSQVAEHAADTIAAEVLWYQWTDSVSDDEVKNVLRNAFDTTEKIYWESIDDKLAERISLQLQITENVTNKKKKYEPNPMIDYRLRTLQTELACGTSALVVLIHQARLYIANVGDSRALLCTTDNDGILNIVQLSQGNFDHTRCLGHFLAKSRYQEFEESACTREPSITAAEILAIQMLTQDMHHGFGPASFRTSTPMMNGILVHQLMNKRQAARRKKSVEESASTAPEPVIAEAEIVGGIPLNGCHGFLLLISSGLYQSLLEATGTLDVNKEIVQMVVKQFQIRSTFVRVAQAVVDDVARYHYNFYSSFAGRDNKATIDKREDMTLLIRNFDFRPPVTESPLCIRVIYNLNADQERWNMTHSSTETLGTGNSSEELTRPTDSESIPGLVKAYVDFRPYYEAVEKAQREGTLPDGIEF